MKVDIEKEIKEVIENKNTIMVKKKKRKAPNESAKEFDIGHIHKSTNDNNKYIVYEDKNKVKKWKKYNENKEIVKI